MSQQARWLTGVRAEWAVRKWSQYGQTLHRTEPDADEPRPACQQSDVDYPDEYAGYLGSSTLSADGSLWRDSPKPR